MSKKITIPKSSINISRADKIILVMYELSMGKRKNLSFEDLVVALFKKHPDHFHLKGYPKFPDSETVNNALYHNLKKKGVINYGNKVFSLTDRGLIVAKELKKITEGKTIRKTSRIPKFIEKEIRRIEYLEGFKLFLNREENKILDIDFLAYLGITVRTPKNDFISRLNTIKDAIKELHKRDNQLMIYKKICEFHEFMIKKFENIIRQKIS